MSNFLNSMNLLSVADTFGTISIVLNFIAAGFLFCALLPPWFEARKTKATYGLSFTFLNYYVLAGVFIVLQNIITLFCTTDEWKVQVLMILFMLVQFVSLTINTNLIKLKKANCAAAAEKGLSEQLYWEKYCKGACQ